MLDHRCAYAESFHLCLYIQFLTKVVRCLPLADGQCEVVPPSSEQRIYKGVIVANRHH
jgi:hypothetical protein